MPNTEEIDPASVDLDRLLQALIVRLDPDRFMVGDRDTAMELAREMEEANPDEPVELILFTQDVLAAPTEQEVDEDLEKTMEQNTFRVLKVLEERLSSEFPHGKVVVSRLEVKGGDPIVPHQGELVPLSSLGRIGFQYTLRGYQVVEDYLI